MAKSTTFLNYIVFFVLYVISFITINMRNTEIVGFYFLFIVNTVCLFYNMLYLTNVDGMDFVPNAIVFAIIISGFFHSISLIFVVMLISNMRVKYSNTFGTPIKLPPKYQQPLELYKKLMLSTFCICAALLLYFSLYYNEININFISEMRSIGNIMHNPFPVVILLITCVPIILSSIDIAIANGFTKLARKQLIQ